MAIGERALLLLLLSTLGLAFLVSRIYGSSGAAEATENDFYSLQGGEEIAIRSLATGKYLTLSAASGRVLASATTHSSPASRWRVLVLDTDTVAALLRSASTIDEHSAKFTGRKMVTASGCSCSGFSNAHGFGRFCHPWEDPMQEAWCYVSDNCTSATSRGSFGRRHESCDAPLPSSDDDEYMRQQSAQFDDVQHSVLVPASGCNCSGFSSKLGFGSYCSGWEYEGQAPWCYIDRACQQSSGAAAGGRWARSDTGSFGQPYEECVWRTPEAPAPALRRRRRLAEAPRASRHRPLASLLASSPDMERYVVLISVASHTFLNVEPPPHREALQLTARSDELSVRCIFSSFERTRLILSLATNSLLNVDEASGEVATGARRGGEQMKLLRMPRRTARWQVERVGSALALG